MQHDDLLAPDLLLLPLPNRHGFVVAAQPAEDGLRVGVDPVHTRGEPHPGAVPCSIAQDPGGGSVHPVAWHVDWNLQELLGSFGARHLAVIVEEDGSGTEHARPQIPRAGTEPHQYDAAFQRLAVEIFQPAPACIDQTPLNTLDGQRGGAHVVGPQGMERKQARLASGEQLDAASSIVGHRYRELLDGDILEAGVPVLCLDILRGPSSAGVAGDPGRPRAQIPDVLVQTLPRHPFGDGTGLQVGGRR